MEEYLVTAVGYLRLVVKAIGAAVVGFGVLATTYRYVLTLVGVREYSNNEIRLYLGRYLALNPTWTAAATTTIVVRKLLTFSLGLPRREPGGGTVYGIMNLNT